VVAPGSPGKWRFEQRVAPSDWMDASHVGWFSSLFDEFRATIAKNEFVGKDAREAFMCVQLIERAYKSAREDSRLLDLEQHPESHLEHHPIDRQHRPVRAPASSKIPVTDTL
jgi:hypothetical protein